MNDVCEIRLPSGEVALVDARDAAAVRSKAWSLASGYAMHFWREGGRTLSVSMHRFIMGASPGEVVDHRDGNPLNNRRENLRLCTAQENQRNKKRGSNNTSGFKGVSRRGERWRAVIACDGKFVEVGAFDSPFGAALAYDQAAERLHGEFARLNFSKERDWIVPYAAEKRPPGRPRRAPD